MPDQERIKNIRISTRIIVQQLGYLNNLFAHIGSISQCYAMHMLEAKELTIHELSRGLDLDRSTVSRLAKDMVTKGYCEYLSYELDGRCRYLKLTLLGHQKLKEIHLQATKQVKNALSKLSKLEQETVTKGLALYASALKNESGEK